MLRSLSGVIVEPKEMKRYNNVKKVGGVELRVNSSINEDDYKFVQRIGVVKKLPLYGNWDLQVGDEVIVHHNVFRRYWGFNCDLRDGDSLFSDTEYVCEPDQVFARKRDGEWKCLFDYCFVKPVKAKKRIFSNEIYKPLVGNLKFGNKFTEELGLQEGDLISFTPDSEYEFNIDGELLYKMAAKDLTIMYYGHQELS